jgi:hypothetical protein
MTEGYTKKHIVRRVVALIQPTMQSKHQRQSKLKAIINGRGRARRRSNKII